MREAVGVPASPSDIAYFVPTMETLRSALGEEEWAAAEAAGRELSRQQAMDEAVALVSPVEATGTAALSAGSAAAHGLTERELEVLRLLATGQSNREIGELLFISPVTAATHVANITTKLGVDSRAKATAYAYQHGLI